MNTKMTMGAIALVAGLCAGNAQAQNSALGKQASQCFVLYKMAAAAPANAAHKGDLAKLGGLMSRTMQDNNVTQKQFDGWTGELLARIGDKNKPNAGVLAKERDTCNAFAQQRYNAYLAKK